jgi:putative flippase GtrA
MGVGGFRLRGGSGQVRVRPLMPSPFRAEFRRLTGFGLVGLAAFAAYLAMVSATVALGGHPVLGAVFGFVLGTLVSLYGNARWVFHARAGTVVTTRFVSVTLLGFLLNLALAWSLTSAGVHHVVMTCIIFAVVPGLNYVGHRLWTFSGVSPERRQLHG